VDGDRRAVAFPGLGQARDVLGHERPRQQLGGRDRCASRLRSAVVLPLRCASRHRRPVACGLSFVRTQQQASDAAQAQRIGVAERPLQQLGGLLGPGRGAVDGELDDRQEVCDHLLVTQRAGPARGGDRQALPLQQVDEVVDRAARAADHGHVVVRDALGMVEVAQDRGDPARLLDRPRGTQHRDGRARLGSRSLTRSRGRRVFRDRRRTDAGGGGSVAHGCSTGVR